MEMQSSTQIDDICLGRLHNGFVVWILAFKKSRFGILLEPARNCYSYDLPVLFRFVYVAVCMFFWIIILIKKCCV